MNGTVDPLVALLVFAGVSGVCAVLFWPRRGVVARVRRIMRMTERVHIEDALKHLFKGEYFQTPRSIESLAGALQVSRGQAAYLLGRLGELGLTMPGAEGLRLTEAGRDYALRVIRTHRVWERYLADETGVAPVDWHDNAEDREHTLSTAEVDRLAAQMGHPLFDPHGDPIPTAEGQLPPARGVALSALGPGEDGTIVHLEDEPREVYERIVAEGLTPLTRVSVHDSTPAGVRFEADGRELTLDPVAAGQVTVERLQPEVTGHAASRTLADLRMGESATVVRISSACQGRQRRRLLDLGLVPGTVVSAELESATHDPVGYRIRGALIALRRQQAEAVYIDREPAGVN